MANTKSSVVVRLAQDVDANEICRIIISQSNGFLVDPDGEEARKFFISLNPPEFLLRMAETNREYAVAAVNGKVVGMIAIRDKNYISQFFVARSHQGQGVGRKLWNFVFQRASASGEIGDFTVGSSLSAEPIYRSFGFTRDGEPEIKDGFRFVQMRRAIDA